MNRIACLVLGALLLISGCDRIGGNNNTSDDTDDNTTPQTQPLPTTDESPGISISRTLVTSQDHLGIPLAGVSVRVTSNGNQLASAISGSDGEVELSGLPANTELVVHFEKEGYAAQMKPLLPPEEDGPVFVTAGLLERGAAQVFSADDEAALVGRDGATVTLPASGLVDADGNRVSGEVEVTITPVDPTTDAGLDAFPGSFVGITDDLEETPIISFGSVEFVFTQNGEPLNLAPGETASILLPMYNDQYPDGSSVNPGDRIPLWYLDEDTGIWMQEGTGVVIESFASPVGLAMEASVSHFTWWNTDWYPRSSSTFGVNLTVISYDDQGNVIHDFDNVGVSVHGTATGYRGGRLSTSFNKRKAGLLFQAFWCFSAKAIIPSPDGQSAIIKSEPVCKLLLEPTDIVIPMTIPDEDMIVKDRLRSTATEGGDYGACGDDPQIEVTSLYPVTFRLATGSLPPGLTLRDDGRITGTPERDGSYTFQVDIESWRADGTRQDYDILITTIDVSEALDFRVTGIEPPYMYVGQSYSYRPFLASGGLPATEITLDTEPPANGAVPSGTTFRNGHITGTPGRLWVNGEPTLLYYAQVDAVITDANCATARDGYLQGVMWGPKLVGEAPLAEAGVPYSYTLGNEEGPIELWEVVRGEGDGLPPWASLNRTTGEISGTPGSGDVDQPYLAYIRASGPELGGINPLAGDFRPEDIHPVTLNAMIQPPELQSMEGDVSTYVGANLRIVPVNIGGAASHWVVTNLPAWASFDSNSGVLSGTPTAVGVHTDIQIGAENAGGSSASEPFTIRVLSNVAAPVLTGTPATGAVGAAFGFTPGNTGGSVDQWTIAGQLPPGLSFADGNISGTPTTAGTYPDIVLSADNLGGSDNLTLAIEIGKGEQLPLTFQNAGPIVLEIGDEPLQNPARGGSGTGSLLYAISDPSVASIDDQGTVTALAVGDAVISATRTADGNYESASASWALSVMAAISIGGTPTPATLYENYSWTPVVTGLTIERWELAAGALPAGLSLDPLSGTLSGRIDRPGGVYRFTLTAFASTGERYDSQFEIEVIAYDCDLWNTDLPWCTLYLDPEVDADFIFRNAFEDGTLSIEGALPEGWQFDADSGRLTGPGLPEGNVSLILRDTEAGTGNTRELSIDIEIGIPAA